MSYPPHVFHLNRWLELENPIVSKISGSSGSPFLRNSHQRARLASLSSTPSCRPSSAFSPLRGPSGPVHAEVSASPPSLPRPPFFFLQSKQVSLEGTYTSRRRSGAHKGLEPLSECPVHAGVCACVRRRISVTRADGDLVPSPHKVVRERIFGHALQNRRNERNRGR